MKTALTIDKSELKRVVSILTWKKGSTLPILKNIKLTIKENVLTLSATDLEIDIAFNYPTTYNGEFEALLNPSEIKTHIELEPTAKIDIDIIPPDVTEFAGSVISACDPKQTLDDYPASYMPKKHIVKNYAVNIDDIVNGMQFSSKDKCRLTLNAVNINEAETVSTDGGRLFYRKNPKVSKKKFSVVIPEYQALYKKLRAFHKKTDTAKLSYFEATKVQAQRYRLEFDNITVTGRTIDGNYPNYHQVIPKSFSYGFLFDIPAMVKICEVAKADKSNVDQYVHFQIDGNADIVRVQEYNYEFPIKSDGKLVRASTTISFQPKKILEYLALHKTDKTCGMKHNDGFSPAQFNDDYILMPMRKK